MNVPSFPPLRSYYAREFDGADLNKIFMSYSGSQPVTYRMGDFTIPLTNEDSREYRSNAGGREESR